VWFFTCAHNGRAFLGPYLYFVNFQANWLKSREL
jgi:hypothetical protein